jgi:hypothetical protein
VTTTDTETDGAETPAVAEPTPSATVEEAVLADHPGWADVLSLAAQAGHVDTAILRGLETYDACHTISEAEQADMLSRICTEARIAAAVTATLQVAA